MTEGESAVGIVYFCLYFAILFVCLTFRRT